MQRLTAEDAVQIYRNNFEAKKEQYDFENRSEIDELIDKIDGQISNDASKLNTNSILYVNDFEIMLGHKLTDIDSKLLLSILKDYYKKQGFRVSGFDDNLTLGWNSDLFKKDNVKDSNKSLDKHEATLRQKIQARVQKAAQDTNDEAKPFADSNAEISEDNNETSNDKQVEFTADQDKFIAKMLNDNLEGEDGSQGSEPDNKPEALDDAITNDDLVADDEPEALDDDTIANDDLVMDDEPEASDSIDDAESDTDLQANDANKKPPLPTLDSQITNLLNQQFQDADSPHTDSKNSHLTD